MKIFKFGGASVATADKIRNLAAIVKKYEHEHILLVISAIGKTTNVLETLVDAYTKHNTRAGDVLDEVKKTHYAITEELFTDPEKVNRELEILFAQAGQRLKKAPKEEYSFIYDQLVSLGELLSTKIVSAYLNEQNIANEWLDVRDVIKTDSLYRAANIDIKATEKNAKSTILPLISKKKIVTQGFIGSTKEGATTTLGREGSDYTAAILGNILDTEDVTIWKDVPGVLNADPRYFKEVRKIKHLSYREAIEMAYYGAKVIHPKTIKPLQNKNISLYVKSFEDPEAEGTLIDNTAVTQAIPPIIVVKKKQLFISAATKDYSFITDEKFCRLYDLFVKDGVNINLVQHSAVTFSVCIDNHRTRAGILLNDLKQEFNILKNEKVELLTIRHYDQKTVDKHSANRYIYMKQAGPDMVQLVMK